MKLIDLIRESIQPYGADPVELRWLAESRYNRSIFPTCGQHDWFDAQLLYCLRPGQGLELSRSSGYSTAFMASGLRRNGGARQHVRARSKALWDCKQ